jgi:hypothetical protein
MRHIIRVREIRIVHTVLVGSCHLRGASVSERCYSYGSESKRSQVHALNSSSLLWVIVNFIVNTEKNRGVRFLNLILLMWRTG